MTTTRNRFDRGPHWFVASCFLLLFCLCGCKPVSPNPNPQARVPASAVGTESTPAAVDSLGKDYALGIMGYNYTNRYIDSFTVNGRGGGNVFISSPTTGGGKTACCFDWWSGNELPKKVRVVWVGAYCILTESNPKTGETIKSEAPIWRATEAFVKGPIPPNPTTLETHFYPDGHVEVAVTDQFSDPRLQLPRGEDRFVRPGTIVNDPPCPPGYDRVREHDRVAYSNLDARTQVGERKP